MTSPFASFPKLQDTIEKIIVELQQQRETRPAEVLSPSGDLVPEWVVFELQILVDLVNVRRKMNGYSPLTYEDILLVSLEAQTHPNPANKLAQYCAELIMFGQVL